MLSIDVALAEARCGELLGVDMRVSAALAECENPE